MGYLVGTIVLSYFFFFAFVFVSRLLYKRRMQIKYSCRNMFPFEFSYKTTFVESFYSHLFFALAFFSLISFFITFDLKHNDGFLNFVMISGIINTILIAGLFYVPLTKLRAHVAIDALFFTFLFLEIGALLLGSWRINQIEHTWNAKTGIFFSGFLVIVSFALSMNPRLTLNFKAVEVVKEDGTKEYVRPKGVVLAFSEWMLILVYFLAMLDIFLLKVQING